MVDVAINSEVIHLLVSSMTQNGSSQLSELEVERFLNALARARVGVPTGTQVPTGNKPI